MSLWADGHRAVIAEGLANLGAEGRDEFVSLYRAVSAEERDDAVKTQLFRANAPHAMEGKWFADQSSHALAWGKTFYKSDPFYVLETKVPKSWASKLFFDPKLDGIGPARYADDLDELNRVHIGINEVKP